MNFSEDRPIFLQLAQQIEDAIVSGAYPEESQIPSITEYSVSYKINPATALKGITLLVDKGLVYKKRGVGMFVATGAKNQLMNVRKERFYADYIKTLVAEAKNLGLSSSELSEMIVRGFSNGD